MANILADRVLESSTSSGTGPFTMAGAVLGFRAFSAVCAVSDTVPYYIEAVDDQGRPTGDWEFGLGTYSASNQLTRTTVRGSSNGGLAVSFPAGTKLVGLGVPAPNTAPTRAEWRTALGFTAFGDSLVTAADAAAARALIGGYKELQPVTAAVASNALTLTLGPTILDFRHPTLGNGAVNTRVVASAINLVISNGSTLGTTSGALARLAVLALDNAGTVELAVVNLAGGVNLDESGVISTTAEGGAGGADSASTVYSAAARSNVPFRVLGFIECTQATAGAWATAPSLVNGGASPLAKWMTGYGQSWQDVTGSRTSTATYTNTTGRKIELSMSVQGTSGATVNASLTVAGLIVQQSTQSSTAFTPPAAVLDADVHPGETFVYTWSGGTASIRERR